MPKLEGFKGFYSPRSTQVPDNYFDSVMPILSGNENKVLLYIFRRTFGFKKERDSISISQMVGGIKTRSGKQLDLGTGLSKSTVVRAVRKLESLDMIRRTKRRTIEKGDEPTTYELVLTDTQPELTPVSKTDTPRVSENATPVSKVDTHNVNAEQLDNSVNGSEKKSHLRLLPNLKQPQEQTMIVADEITTTLGDSHSLKYYQLVAAKIEYPVIQKALSQIRNDGGAQEPAKVFVKRMEQYAAKKLKTLRGKIAGES